MVLRTEYYINLTFNLEVWPWPEKWQHITSWSLFPLKGFKFYQAMTKVWNEHDLWHLFIHPGRQKANHQKVLPLYHVLEVKLTTERFGYEKTVFQCYSVLFCLLFSQFVTSFVTTGKSCSWRVNYIFHKLGVQGNLLLHNDPFKSEYQRIVYTHCTYSYAISHSSFQTLLCILVI